MIAEYDHCARGGGAVGRAAWGASGAYSCSSIRNFVSIAKRALTGRLVVLGRDRLGVGALRSRSRVGRRASGRFGRVLALGRHGLGPAEAARTLEDLGEESARPDCAKAGERARGGPAAVVAMRAGANSVGSRVGSRRWSQMTAFQGRQYLYAHVRSTET